MGRMIKSIAIKKKSTKWVGLEEKEQEGKKQLWGGYRKKLQGIVEQSTRGS